ncbi:MAG: membrane protein insertase YidC [Streptosporangiaceae bacterium]
MQALDPLNNLVAWVIMRIHAVLGSLFGPASGLAWGLSIVILVMFIRLLLVPLFIKQVHAQRKMAQHAPQLQELRKKYKGDKQRLNEETMKFYKENGVNPLAGCLPMIPQMIVFFALFNVLRAITTWVPGTTPRYGLTVPVVVSAQKATIFGVHLGDKLLFSHQSVPLHVSIVIALTVVVSATTTFMTVRQSAKRGLMQTGSVDPDNPMAQSQKYMQYIIPFFSLTGLYWQYGLVLYWVTTNLWTLGQQFFMFRNWEPIGAAGAAAGATTAGPVGPVRAAKSSPRPGSPRPGSPGASGSGAAKAAAGGARTGGPRTGSAAGDAKAGTASGRPASAGSGSARVKGTTATSSGASSGASSGRTSNGSGAPRTGTASRPATSASQPSTGQNGTEKRGLLRLGRAKPEPEPQDDVPTAKVVRQQPVRQARSKRSGKR